MSFSAHMMGILSQSRKGFLDPSLYVNANTDRYVYEDSFSNMATVQTMEVSFYLNSLSNISIPVCAGNAYDSHITLAIRTDGSIHNTRNFGGVGGWITASGVISLNTWHHVAVTVTNDTTSAMYLDGSFISGSTPSSWFGGNTVTDRMVLGGRLSGASQFPLAGYVGEVRFWSTIRTASQINNNYNIPLVGNETGLMRYYRLNGDATDETGTANATESASVIYETP